MNLYVLKLLKINKTIRFHMVAMKVQCGYII